MLEQVLVATTGVLEERTTITAPWGGTDPRLAIPRTRPVEGVVLLVVVG